MHRNSRSRPSQHSNSLIMGGDDSLSEPDSEAIGGTNNAESSSSLDASTSGATNSPSEKEKDKEAPGGDQSAWRDMRRKQHRAVEQRRRERMNRHYSELDALCIRYDPSLQQRKRERDGILVNAIRIMSQLQEENAALRAAINNGAGAGGGVGVGGGGGGVSVLQTSTNVIADFNTQQTSADIKPKASSVLPFSSLNPLMTALAGGPNGAIRPADLLLKGNNYPLDLLSLNKLLPSPSSILGGNAPSLLGGNTNSHASLSFSNASGQSNFADDMQADSHQQQHSSQSGSSQQQQQQHHQEEEVRNNINNFMRNSNVISSNPNLSGAFKTAYANDLSQFLASHPPPSELPGVGDLPQRQNIYEMLAALQSKQVQQQQLAQQQQQQQRGSSHEAVRICLISFLNSGTILSVNSASMRFMPLQTLPSLSSNSSSSLSAASAVDSLFNYIHPDDVSKLISELRILLSGQVRSFSSTRRVLTTQLMPLHDLSGLPGGLADSSRLQLVYVPVFMLITVLYHPDGGIGGFECAFTPA